MNGIILLMEKETRVPFISIIVLIHNIEYSFLDVCFKSLMSQTDRDFEALLVCDNNHFDESRVPADARFRVVNVPPCSVGAARNIGLKNAKGTYVTFLDSDDLLNFNFVAEVKLITDSSAFSLICFNHKQGTEPNFPNQELITAPQIVDLSAKEAQRLFLSPILSHGEKDFGLNLGVCWAKVYQRDFLLDQKIWFDESLTLGEDVNFVLACGLKANRVALIPNFSAVYYRLGNASSAVGSLQKQFTWLEPFVASTYRVLKEAAVSPEYLEHFPYYYVDIFASSYVVVAKAGGFHHSFKSKLSPFKIVFNREHLSYQLIKFAAIKKRPSLISFIQHRHFLLGALWLQHQAKR